MNAPTAADTVTKAATDGLMDEDDFKKRPPFRSGAATVWRERYSSVSDSPVGAGSVLRTETDAPTDPKQRVMVEERLGPYEKYLLKLSAGNPNVYEFAETQDIGYEIGYSSGGTYDSDEDGYEMH